MNINEENKGLAGAGNMDDVLDPTGYIAVLKPENEQPKEFNKPHPAGFEYMWDGYTKLEDGSTASDSGLDPSQDCKDLDPVDVRILLGADDNALLFVAAGHASLEPRGPQGGGNYEEVTSESFKMVPEKYYPASLWYENINYQPADQNVAILKTRLNGNPIRLYDLIPKDQKPEKKTCDCPCDRYQDGGVVVSSNVPAAALAASGSFSPSSLSSSSAGNRTTATSDEDAMIWRINFGVLRGLMGVPGGHLELVRFTGGSYSWNPAALDYRHPLADKLDIPQGGIVENGMVRIRVGSDRRHYLITKSGPSAMGVTALRGERATLLTAQKTPTVDIASAAYMRIEQNDKSRADYNIATGRLDSYTTPLQQTWSAAELAAHLDVVRDGAGALRQIRNTWDGLLCIENITDTGYTIALYLPSQITGQDIATGLYTTEGSPFKTYAVSGNPETGRLATTEQAAGRAPHSTVWWQQNRVWNMIQGSGEESVHTLRGRVDHEDGTWTVVTRVRIGAEGADASCTAEKWQNSPYGPQRLSRTEGHGSTAAITTQYTWNGSGRLIGETAPDGSITSYGYAAGGRIRSISTPWAGGGERVSYTYYRNETGNDDDIAYTRTALIKNNEPTHLDRTDYTYIETDHLRRVEQRSTALGSPHTRLEITETWLGTSPNALDRGRVRMTQSVDGTQTWYAYAATAEHGAIYTITAETRVAGEPVVGQSSRSIRYIDVVGNIVCAEEYALTVDGEWNLLDQAHYTFDDTNKWTRRTRANGRVTERENMCCGPLWEKDEDGITMTYAYDSLRRNIETIRSATETTPETIVSRSYDALGRTLFARTDIGSMMTIESQSYDLLGRLVNRTDTSGRMVEYSYSTDGLMTTVKIASGATFIAYHHADGSLLEQSGTGQRHILYYIDTVADGIRVTARTSMSEGHLLLQRQVINGFGETIRVASQNSAGGSNYLNSSYNIKGQLVQQKMDQQAPVLYQYDMMGQPSKRILAIDEQPDMMNSRIVAREAFFEKHNDGVYKISTRKEYSDDGTPIMMQVGSLVSALDLTIASKRVETDPRGNTTTSWSVYGESAKRTNYVQSPVSDTLASTVVIDGYVMQRTTTSGVTTNYQRHYTTAGSVEIVMDSRGNASKNEYDVVGRLVNQTDALGHVKTIIYDVATGQPAVVIDALGNEVWYKYDHRGRKISENGTGTYPVRYSYDDSDHIVQMETWRYPGKNIHAIDDSLKGDITRWEYAKDTGLLQRKIYSDGSHTMYISDENNRLKTIRQSRGVESSCSYAPLTGELLSVIHSDDTPGEVYTYNHLGQVRTYQDVTGIRMISYNEYGEPDNERTTGFVDSVLKYKRDSFGRKRGYTIDYAGQSLQNVEIAYDAKNRIGNVCELSKNPYIYEYHELSGFPKTLLYPNALERWFLYEEQRNLITAINYLRPDSANYPAKTDYTYDAMGSPVTKKDYWNTSTPGRIHNYTYNTRGEIEADNIQPSGKRSWSYDNIGNRKDIIEPARSIHYTSTPLNQYSAIGNFMPQYDSDGNQTKIKTSTGEWTVSYNANNRPVIFEQRAKRITCTYDCKGRRIEKSIWENNLLVKRYRYIYNGYVLIAEIDATNEQIPQVRATYLWDPAEPEATRVLHMNLWENNAVKETLYYTHDLQKNVTALFGQQIGRRALYEYDPYGNLINMTGDAAKENPFRYSSEYYDDELGLVYYNYRHYNPLDGRWINRDPIMENGGTNIYGFVRNASNRFIDRYGLFFEWLEDATDAAWNAGSDAVDAIWDTGAGAVEAANNFLQPVQDVCLMPVRAVEAAMEWQEGAARYYHGQGYNMLSSSVLGGMVGTAKFFGITDLMEAGLGYEVDMRVDADRSATKLSALDRCGKACLGAVSIVTVTYGLGRATSVKTVKTTAQSVPSATPPCAVPAPKELAGNPFKGKTPVQIEKMFLRKGYIPKGKNPLWGEGGYENLRTKRSFCLDPHNRYGELPHVDGNRKSIFGDYSKKMEKKKFFGVDYDQSQPRPCLKK